MQPFQVSVATRILSSCFIWGFGRHPFHAAHLATSQELPR